MNILIEASNIKTGGGLIHLKELLNHASRTQLQRIEVLTSEHTARQLPETVSIITVDAISRGFLRQIIWKLFIRSDLFKKYNLVFTVGGGKVNGKPYVTMCQNLLPIQKEELNRYKYSINWLRLLILRKFHFAAYRDAAGVIFLNKYCKNVVGEELKVDLKNVTIIPHGINPKFFKSRESYDINNLMKLIYVSTIDVYKHQWNVAEAVLQLNNDGCPIELHLVGPEYGPARKRLDDVLSNYENSESVILHGKIPYEELDQWYEEMDAAIYASTCETFGMTLLESMAAALPIACSISSSMPEMLNDAGIYFDPENITEIKEAILKLYKSEELRKQLGQQAKSYAKEYDWKRTTKETFRYLEEIAAQCAG